MSWQYKSLIFNNHFWWLFGKKKMNLQERLEQCRKDKAAIEKEEQELLEQIKIEKQKEEITFASVAKIVPDYGGRLILYLTPKFVKTVNRHAGEIVSFGSTGTEMCNATNRQKLTNDSLMNNYSQKDIQKIFN